MEMSVLSVPGTENAVIVLGQDLPMKMQNVWHAVARENAPPAEVRGYY
jgi:hypothetical protein